MNVFRLWAPELTRVDVVTQGRKFPMRRTPTGWWSAEVALGGPEEDYAFSLDGGPERPDPRSPWQPHGVHGPSRMVDHRAFGWTDEGFQAKPLSAALVYELHVGTFTPAGTFDAGIAKLDHLRELGVTHVELMPVGDFPGRFGWGYDGVALYAPRQAYGGPAALKRLVNACHARGLGVLLDVVYNHLGPQGNYLPQLGPYFSERHATPWGAALNFDGSQSDEVRRFFIDNALMWLRDYHLDGLRLDAAHAVIDASAVHFLEQLATEVDELQAHLGRHFVLIAESDLNDPRLMRRREIGGFGLDAQWSDDFHHALHAVITGEREGYFADFGGLADLAMAFQQPYLYDGRHSQFRRRRHGRPATGLSGHSFLGYMQNHDQIGNRAQGDRLSRLVSVERVKIAAALVLTSPYVPMLFQGEEWGATAPFQFFADFSEDPELARLVSEGRRKEFEAFGWSPQAIPDPGAPETFQRSKLDWSELAREPHAGLLDWHRQLIRLRRKLSGLTDGRLDRVRTRHSESDQWLIVERGPVSVLVNFSDEPRNILLEAGRPSQLLLTSAPGAIDITPSEASLPGNSVAILGPDSSL